MQINEELLEKTRPFYFYESKGLYHELISLIISQRISFKKSRDIRMKIYEKIGSYVFTKDKLFSINLIETGLDVDKIHLIRNINENVSFNDLKAIPGIGIWTIKSLKAKLLLDDDIFLSEDFYIRTHLKILFKLDKVPIISEANKLIKGRWEGYKTHVSLFLWRLRHESTDKLIQNQELTQQDFI
jgi:3-methyladenine DNA glycosylase/8-oxoguanine DNA glycosylase